MVRKGEGIEWITPTLLNGWTHNDSNTLQYSKNSLGEVTVRGEIANGSLTGVVFILPKGFRPITYQRFPALKVDGALSASNTLNSNGEVKVFVPDTYTTGIYALNFSFKAEQ